jgi:L-rhamnose mutarotase
MSDRIIIFDKEKYKKKYNNLNKIMKILNNFNMRNYSIFLQKNFRTKKGDGTASFFLTKIF